MPTCYSYVRVSTDQQAASGLSEEAQAETLERHYRLKYEPRGFSWREPYRDSAVSAAKLPFRKRRYGRELLGVLQRGDCVLFAKLDRGFRNVADCAAMLREFQEAGVSVEFLDLGIDTGTPFGSCLVHIAAAFAELEAKLISERILVALAQAKARGQALGCPSTPPYGYRYEGKGRKRKLVPDPGSRTWGKLFVEWHARGWTVEQMVLYLEREGARNPNSREPKGLWTFGAVQRHYAAERRLALEEELKGGAK